MTFAAKDLFELAQVRGLHLFPVKAGAKFPPLIREWPTQATNSAPVIEAWWKAEPTANAGVHCGGLLVVDVDPKAGGIASFQKLELLNGFDLTYTVRTPSGGVHLYYCMPNGADAQNTVGKVAPGIDTRGRNGYVLAAGSVIEAGAYTLVPDRDLPIAPAPQWLVAAVAKGHAESKRHDMNDVPDAPPFAVDKARIWLRTAERSTKGQGGDQTAYRVACRMRDFGLSYAQTCDLMRSEAWGHGCGWRDGWLEQKPIASAYKYAQGEAGDKVALPDDFPVAVEPAPHPAQAHGPTRLKVFAQEAAGSTDYIVKGLLYRNSYTMMYGHPGEGKTFMALDILYHIAAGKPWHDRKVRQGAVLYLAYEGMGGMRKRAQALIRQYGEDDVPMFITGAAFNLRDKVGRQLLGSAIASLPVKPVAIVLDTFNHALCGADENSAQDVGEFNNGVQALIEATGACVIVLHHPTKAGTGARGSGALGGAIDAELYIEAGRMTATKQRDVELGAPIGFKLSPIVIGQDEDDEDVTSCVVVSVPVREAAMQEKLKGKYKLTWDTLCQKRKDNTPITDGELRQACEEFLPRKADWPEVRMRLRRDGLIEIDDAGLIRRTMF